jgi:hypothetical protein
VPACHLRRLALKELVDNALDIAETVTVTKTIEGSYVVQDDGPGIPPETVGHLFSLNRPLVSSKLLRLPTRGAMGNGLRVVAGAVAASDGTLEVWTRNRRLILTMQADGTTAVQAEPIDFPVGTRIEVGFGPALPYDAQAMAWAENAIVMAKGGQVYQGKSSPHWYDPASFFELLQAAGNRPVRDLIVNLEGCTGGKAGKVVGDLKGRSCQSISRDEALMLLRRAKAEARPVSTKRIGHIGSDGPYLSHARIDCLLTIGHSDPAEVPAVIEVWADAERGEDADVFAFVNRTPITGQMYADQNKKTLRLRGCGLREMIDTGKARFTFVINITTPYMPITTDSKEPDFVPFQKFIVEAVRKAAGRARRILGWFDDEPPSEKRTHKDIVTANLPDAIAQASGNHAYRFNQRQLFYVMRPIVIAETGSELAWPNFCQIITGYEAENGDIPGMFRDTRGTLYHPHERRDIPLGTLAVESYERPAWVFNKVLYIEKEGLFETLKDVHWPERHDCALLTSKGFATRAVRDLIDMLAEDGEPLTVFCVHDADAAGTTIYQSLQNETKARGRRLIEIVNLGLEPWEALEMGLEPERMEDSDRRRPVADYAKRTDDIPGTGEEIYWPDWLQTFRIELNAMTSPQFLAWLDAKMVAYGGKVIPPEKVMDRHLREEVAITVSDRAKARALRDASERIAKETEMALDAIQWPDDDELLEHVTSTLETEPDRLWSVAVGRFAESLADDVSPEAF